MYPELFNKEFLKNVNNYVDLEGAGRKCNTSLFSPYNTLVIGQPLNSQMKKCLEQTFHVSTLMKLGLSKCNNDLGN